MSPDIGAIFFALIFLIVLAAFFVLIYWRTAREWNAYFLLKKGGVPCTVTVDHAYRFRGIEWPYHNPFQLCYVRFWLDPDLVSGNLQVTQRIGYEKFRALRDGAKLTARYLSYNPKIANLSDLHEDLSVRNMLTVIAVIGFVIFPLFILPFLVMYLLDRVWIVYSPR